MTAPVTTLESPRPPRVRPRRRGLALTLRALGPFALLAAWWAASATGLLTRDVLAQPAEVLDAVRELWGNRQLPDALAASLTRSGSGLVIGLTAGLTLGVVTGFTRLGDELLDSSLQTLRSIPFLALVPLFMVCRTSWPSCAARTAAACSPTSECAAAERDRLVT